MKPTPRRSGDRDSSSARSGSFDPRTARELAFLCLKAFDDSGAYLADSLDRLQETPLSPADRALAMELSYTVLRRRMTVDAVLRQLVDRDPASVERGLWTVLQLGVVQLLLIPGLPSHAAVHETVELAKRANPRWGGMVNGVLRSAQRMITGDGASVPSSSGIPIVSVAPAPAGTSKAVMTIEYRQLNRPVLPDYERDALAWASVAFSIPRDLIARWPDGWNPDSASRLAAWFATAGVMSLRVNLRRKGRDEVIEVLRAAGVDCWPGEFPESIRLAEATRIARLPGFDAGDFSVQDESAMRIVDLLAPQSGERILDLCAAPGGKSTHAAERMNDQGTVIACDLSPRRLRMVDESAGRLGLQSVTTVPITDDEHSIPAGPFDAAIVDAPCSNMGVLGKRPEARWRLSETDFVELPALQLRLLTAAGSRVRSGGRLVYSTCSIDALENEGVVRAFMKEDDRWTLEQQHRSTPGEPADGGHVAVLRRS